LDTVKRIDDNVFYALEEFSKILAFPQGYTPIPLMRVEILFKDPLIIVSNDIKFFGTYNSFPYQELLKAGQGRFTSQTRRKFELLSAENTLSVV